MFCPMCGSKLSTQGGNAFGYTRSVRCSAGVCTGCQIEYGVILDDQATEYLSITGRPLQMPDDEEDTTREATTMDEKKLLRITKNGCPDCGSVFNLHVAGLESFKQSVSYNAVDDELAWDEPDYLGVTEAAACCIMCGWEEALNFETLTAEDLPDLPVFDLAHLRAAPDRVIEASCKVDCDLKGTKFCCTLCRYYPPAEV